MVDQHDMHGGICRHVYLWNSKEKQRRRQCSSRARLSRPGFENENLGSPIHNIKSPACVCVCVCARARTVHQLALLAARTALLPL